MRLRTLSITILTTIIIALLAPAVLPQAPDVSVTPKALVWPEFVQNGEIANYTFTLTNSGPLPITCSITSTQIQPAAGWLDVTHSLLTIPASTGNTAAFDVVISAPSFGEQFLTGSVKVTFTDTAYWELTIPVRVWSAEIIEPPGIYDTVASSDDWDGKGLNDFVALTMANHGEQGGMGIGHVNMDFVTGGTDCDTNATVYLKSSSPFVAIKRGTEVSITSSLYSTNVGSGFSWVPLPGAPMSGGLGSTNSQDYDSVFTGRMANRDTSLWIERIFYTPRNNPGLPNFVLVRTVLGADEVVADSIVIGEVTDWDIPSDSLSGIACPNVSGVTLPGQEAFVYFQGFTDSASCILNNTRFATNTFLTGYDEGDDPCNSDTDFWGSWGAPASRLALDSLTGEPPTYWWDSLYTMPGLWSTPDLIDQGQFLTYEFLPGMSAGDRRVYWTVYVTGYDMLNYEHLAFAVEYARDWSENFYCPYNFGCCIGNRGNIDGSMPDDVVTLGDVAAFTDIMFISQHDPWCMSEANVDLSADSLVTIGDFLLFMEFYFNSPFPPSDTPACADPLIPMQMYDTGERDSVRVNIVPPTMYADDSTFLFEVYLYNDVQGLRGCSMGWVWDDSNMTLIDMELTPEALQVFSYRNDAKLNGDVDLARPKAEGGMFGLTLGSWYVWSTSASARKVATFTFRISDWSIEDTIVFRDTSYNCATNLTFTYPSLKSYPPWTAGEIVYYDTDYDDDGWVNEEDNCPYRYNPGQEDENENGIGDVCEICCIGDRGNVDADPDDILSLGDLTALIDVMFISLDDPWCWEEANLDGSLPEGPGSVSLGDLTAMIDFLFISLCAPPDCP